MTEYAHPEMLVTTAWVAEHGRAAGVRLLEVDVDTTAYDRGHIRGALGVDWTTQLCDPVRRDLLSPQGFEALCSQLGLTPDTTVVFYGDNNNWFAAYALWQFRYYGHAENKLRLMDGGRVKWISENRPITRETPSFPAATYRAHAPDARVRALKDQVMATLQQGAVNLVDVRSPVEFSGEVIAPPGMSETAQRGGHIPGAVSVPWIQTVKEDGTFKSYDELKKLYEGKGVRADKDTITYCRIGERSAHSWFVLKYLLGYPNVANYDGSWVEWGNMMGMPIERR